MNLIETDVLYALLNSSDAQHKAALRLFEQVKEGKLRASISSLSLLELELLIRSGDILIKGKKASEEESKEWFEDLCIALKLYNTSLEPIECEDITLSAELRFKYNLSFFDSHYAAQALRRGFSLISADKAYDKVKGMSRIVPDSI